MQLVKLSNALTLFVLTLSPLLISARKPSNSILLSTVKTLTLRADQQTTHRRVSAIPQLSCVGGNAKGLYDIDVMRCKNAGTDYDPEDIQWTCQASLPPEFKLGSTEVYCEGYDSPEDPYVLKGSCGVEYRLVLTEAGEQKYGTGGFDRLYKQTTGAGGLRGIVSALFTVLFWAVFIGVVVIFFYRIFYSPNGAGGARRRPFGFGGGGGGGGGDDGHDDPPPPYTPRAPKPSSSYRANQAPGAQAGNNAWRPGFWSGAATGAAAAYAMGNRGNTRTGGWGGYGGDAQPGPSNWFGGSRGPTNGGAGFGGGGSSSSASSSAPSSSRYSSTGFGGTTRR